MIKDIVILVLFVLLLILGRNSILSLFKKLLNKFLPNRIKERLFVKKRHAKYKSIQDVIYPILSSEQELAIKNAIKITFTGDLILLKDMVENGYDDKSNQYEFDSMFQYVKNYYRDADYNIGIFEGPVAGENKGYSTSCFNDGIPIFLNFPKEYAQAVKRAGFDMVSLANNHMLDQGVDGLYATLDVFDSIGLSHTGAYRNQQEKSVVTLVDVRGKKIALLPFTYGSNYYDTDFFFLKDNRHLSRIIVDPDNKHIKESLESVRKDFQEAKSLNPDAIIVIPHMGKQFRHAPDEFQKYWCEVFAENGADIIFSDHPHAVQPIEWMNVSDRQVLVVHCPGNFVNSYIKRDGDASMIVECYLDSETGKPFASACIPLYAYCKFGKGKKENYCGVPIYTMLRDKNIEFGKYEYDRICDVQRLVTKVALGTELQIDNVQDRYFFLPKIGYVRQMIKNNSYDMTVKDNIVDNGVKVDVMLEG